MGYRYLDHLTWADTAFEASAPSLESLFASAADATLGTMVSDLSSVRDLERRQLSLCAHAATPDAAIEMLLHDFLQKLVFYKDAEFLLLRPRHLQISHNRNEARLSVELWGEGIDPLRHGLLVDVKAVTMHQFRVNRDEREWTARVVLDV